MTGENKNEFYLEIWWISREGTAGKADESFHTEHPGLFFSPQKISFCFLLQSILPAVN